MVNHERVADSVYSFQSDAYVQVNAGVVAGPNWAVVIDTLAFPEETLSIRDFVEQELKVPVRYVINTHYHADHSWGNCFFPGAMVISSVKCRELLDTVGRSALAETKKENPGIFRQSKIVLPQMTFEEGVIGLRVGKKTLSLFALPGHSVDGIGVLIEEDRVLFTGDVFMSLPTIFDGDIGAMETSLLQIAGMGLENIVQGHGDIVLRGEIEGAVQDNIGYLKKIQDIVEEASKEKYPLDVLDMYDVETCKKSRVLLGGLAEELHRRNLISLYQKLYGVMPEGSGEYDDDYYYEDDEEFEDSYD